MLSPHDRRPLRSAAEPPSRPPAPPLSRPAARLLRRPAEPRVPRPMLRSQGAPPHDSMPELAPTLVYCPSCRTSSIRSRTCCRNRSFSLISSFVAFFFRAGSSLFSRARIWRSIDQSRGRAVGTSADRSSNRAIEPSGDQPLE